MPNDRNLLLTAILADAINLGLNRMAEACPGSSLSRLSWIVDWHVRDETYSKALAEIVNYHHRLAFADTGAKAQHPRRTDNGSKLVGTDKVSAKSTPAADL